MGIISIIGPKGGIGKTTLAINTAAALTRALSSARPGNQVCLLDLDLRLPTITGILDSHPGKTFYDLFETLANHTYQVDFLRTLYRILASFKGYLQGDIPANSRQLQKSISIYKNLSTELFHFGQFEFGDQIHELFLSRGEIHRPKDLAELGDLLDRIDIEKFKITLRQHENNSRPDVEEYISYIEEYGFSILGGEVPILGKKSHRKRINEPAFLALFLEFVHRVCEKFEYVVLDTPAGGVNHLSSLMNSIDQVIFIFDMSNTIAVNGSIDALHTFIDYYEDFYRDYKEGRLTGLDKAYVNRLIAAQGEEAVTRALENKKMGGLFNRCEKTKDIGACLDRLREYLETLDKYTSYRDRIHLIGMVPHHKIINITNNRGTLFYDKDRTLSNRMDVVAQSIINQNSHCPTLAHSNEAILEYLQKKPRFSLASKISRIASSLS